MRRFLVSLSATLLTALLLSPCVTPSVFAQGVSNLPDIGSPSSATLSLEDEYRLGNMVIRGMRDQGEIMEDPEVSEYIQSLGMTLVSEAQQLDRNFQFFVAKDPEINAFALPGGFIAMHSGLFLATRNESELAAVMAHEISHVTQRHIARSLTAQSRNGIVSTAAMLAAILLGAAAGGDAAIGGIAAVQSMTLQNQMSFSRENEFEADAVGITLTSRAGFDPNGMWRFFEVLQAQSGTTREADIPAILRNHPVTTDRIADTRARSAKLFHGVPENSLTYEMMKERIRVLLAPAGSDPRNYYSRVNKSSGLPQQYGKALALVSAGRPDQAVDILNTLVADHPAVMQLHSALGQAQSAAGDNDDALKTLEHGRTLFFRNVPVTIRYAEALIRAGNAKQAHEVLLDLYNVVPPTPDQAKQIAFVANAAGDVADAYYYMSEYYILSGDLSLSMNQLQLALSVPQLTPVQRARFEARLEQVQRAMPKKMRVGFQNGDGGGPPGGGRGAPRLQ